MRVRPEEIVKMIKVGRRELRSQDWTPADQAAWFVADSSDKMNFVENRTPKLKKRTLILKDAQYIALEDQVHNSFVNAALHNIKRRQGDREYKTMKQRHMMYDFSTFMIRSNVNQPIQEVKFFIAATITTGKGGVMEAETADAQFLLLNKETVLVIGHINRILLSRNLPIMGKLLYLWKEPRSPISDKKVTPFIFDIHMVLFEQNHVQDYLETNQNLITAKVKEDFSENLMDVDSWESRFSAVKTNMQWALRALNKPKIKVKVNPTPEFIEIEDTVLDFMSFKDRVFIGIAAIHRLHGKKYEEFESFVKKSGNIKRFSRIRSL